MRTFAAASPAAPAAAWALMAEPRRWHEWAPHVRGAWALGEPEIRLGALGAARAFGVLPVPAKITAKAPGRAWTWRVGPVELVHRVEPAVAPGGGCVVAIDLCAPGPLEPLLAAAYGPVIRSALERLARVAA
jgi:hypothetical protein